MAGNSLNWQWNNKVRKAREFGPRRPKLEPTDAQLRRAAITARGDALFWLHWYGPKGKKSIGARQHLSQAVSKKPVTLPKVSILEDQQ